MSKTKVTLAKRTIPSGARPVIAVKVKPASSNPTGKVVVRVDGRKVKTVKLKAKASGKTGNLTLPRLTKVGKHKIQVAYEGSSALLASTGKAAVRVSR